MFYSLYLFVILFNFTQNIQPSAWSQSFHIQNKYLVAFVGLPINFLINATYMLFYKQYFSSLNLNKAVYKKLNLLIFGNLLFCIIQFFIEIIWPDKPFYFRLSVLFLTLLMASYPLFLMWKEKFENYFYILLGSLLLLIGFILSILATITNNYTTTQFDTDLTAVLGAVAEILLFNYAIQDMHSKNERALLIAEQEKKRLLFEEHIRLSADLHDEVGSTLTSIHILSKIIKDKIGFASAEFSNYATQLESQVGRVMQSISDIVWGFRSDLNTMDDFVIRLHDLLQQTLEPCDILYHINIQPSIKNLSLNNLQRTNLLLVFKESINNIIKYAEASKVDIKLSDNKAFLEMTITDNGIGIKAEKLNTRYGNGLRNMEKRMLKLNGSFQINSVENKGTSLKFAIPL